MIEKNPNVTCLFTKDDWLVWEEINSRCYEQLPIRPIVKCPHCEFVGLITKTRRHKTKTHGYIPLSGNVDESYKIVGYNFSNTFRVFDHEKVIQASNYYEHIILNKRKQTIK